MVPKERVSDAVRTPLTCEIPRQIMFSVETSFEEAREKIAHCFRRLREIDTKRESSSKAKKRTDRETVVVNDDEEKNGSSTTEVDGTTKRTKPLFS